MPPVSDPTRKDQTSNPHVWEHGWEDHEQKQLERLAKLSFAEKLDWLEEAQRLVLEMQAAQKLKKDPTERTGE
jgi:hypothetical protein